VATRTRSTTTRRRRRTATARTTSGRRTLSARQRNKLPRSAFLDPTNRRFPVPTKGQARTAGISESQRLGILRNALARSAQRQARGVKTVTPAMTRRKVAARAGGAIASVQGRGGGGGRRRTRAS
jgi:hypothetical protein